MMDYSVIFSLLYVSIFVVKTDSFVLSCYYNSPAVTRTHPYNYKISDIPANTCDYVMYSFIGLNGDTFEVEILDYDRDVAQGGFRKAVAYKKRSPKTRVLIALGGWGEGVEKYSDMVFNDYSRRVFVKSVVHFINEYRFDGLDLDWEYPGDIGRGGRYTDKENYVRLLAVINLGTTRNCDRNLTHVDGNSLRLSRSSKELWIMDMIVRVWDCRLLDHVNVMTYDMRGTWSGAADNHSPLYRRPFDVGRFEVLNALDVMNMWVSCGFPRHKLVMGIPFYARSYTLAEPWNCRPNSPIRGGGKKTVISNETGVISYFEICTLINTGNCVKYFDEIGRVPYLVCGDQWIGYDDVSSVREKTTYAISQGYGGVMMWSVDQDDTRNECGSGKNSLLKSIMSVWR